MKAENRIFALVDVNNCYVSCERIFNPSLNNRPVIVLSSNDGCAVARSQEAKDIGIKMGVPVFQIQDIIKKHDVQVFSSNFALYGAMSRRFMTLLGMYVAPGEQEIYSVDECFLDLTSYEHLFDLTDYAQDIRKTAWQWLTLPCCVGIGRSKTEAKIANHLAKKNKFFNGVCNLVDMDPCSTEAMLAQIDVGEVWGVGRKLEAQLKAMEIKTALQLREASPALIRAKFTVVLERTVRELRGVSCLDLEEVAPDKQQIMCSRSFGQYVYDRDPLAEVVASYVARAAEKLRQQGSLAGALSVFIRTNPFNPKEPQYQRNLTLPLPDATSDTRELVYWASHILRRLYRLGYAYQKAGVMLSDLRPAALAQGSLLAAVDPDRSQNLMATLDAINQRWGRGTLKTAAEGVTQPWQMKRQRLSPRYTTDWAGLPSVLAS